MQTKPMIIIGKHSITLRPELPDQLLGYIHFCRDAIQKRLDEYVRERNQHTSQEALQQDSALTEAQRKISQAEALIAELEQLRGHVSRSYERDFDTWAEVFRKTRIALEHERFQDNYTLNTAVMTAMELLQQDNPYFSRDKFESYINNEEVV